MILCKLLLEMIYYFGRTINVPVNVQFRIIHYYLLLCSLLLTNENFNDLSHCRIICMTLHSDSFLIAFEHELNVSYSYASFLTKRISNIKMYKQIDPTLDTMNPAYFYGLFDTKSPQNVRKRPCYAYLSIFLYLI